MYSIAFPARAGLSSNAHTYKWQYANKQDAMQIFNTIDRLQVIKSYMRTYLISPIRFSVCCFYHNENCDTCLIGVVFADRNSHQFIFKINRNSVNIHFSLSNEMYSWNGNWKATCYRDSWIVGRCIQYMFLCFSLAQARKRRLQMNCCKPLIKM